MSRNGNTHKNGHEAEEKLSEMLARLGEKNYFQFHKLHTHRHTMLRHKKKQENSE